MTITAMTIGSRIKQVREERGVSRPQLAKLAGIPYPTLAGIENDDQSGSTRLHAIAKALRVNVEWLETGNGPKEPVSQPASLSVSRPVRLDPDIVDGVARAMQDVFELLHYKCSVADTIAIFAELYSRVSASGITTADVVWLAKRVEQGAETSASRSNVSSG
jgi:transcriptional regulator with XRE-family HTH domain